MKKEQAIDRGRMGSIIQVKSLICIISLFFIAAVLTGCAGTTVNVHRHLYKPDIPASVAGFYKGKQIDLNTVINMDKKTQSWTYYNPDKTVAYKASVSLEYYVMDCFRDAFWSTGMSVFYETPEPNVSDMQLIIDSLTDVEFKFSVLVNKNAVTIFKNQFVVTMPPADKTDTAQMEKNAYIMMNKAVVAVLSDKKFQEAVK